MMLCTIWYHLYNLKNGKNTYRGPAEACNCTKSNTSPWVFFTFLVLNCKARHFQNKRLELFSKLQVAITRLWEELEVEPTTDIEQQLCQSDAEEAFVLSTQKLDELTRLQQKVMNYYVSLESFKFFFINFKTLIGYVM